MSASRWIRGWSAENAVTGTVGFPAKDDGVGNFSFKVQSGGAQPRRSHQRAHVSPRHRLVDRQHFKRRPKLEWRPPWIAPDTNLPSTLRAKKKELTSKEMEINASGPPRNGCAYKKGRHLINASQGGLGFSHEALEGRQRCSEQKPTREGLPYCPAPLRNAEEGDAAEAKPARQK